MIVTMERLKEFRKVNNLTQEQLGEYLGIKKSFISRIENGQAPLPEEKFKKLIGNTMGWIVDPLTVLEEADPVPNSAKLNQTIEQKKIEMLEKRIAELEKQNREYWDMIKQLIVVVDR